MVLREPVFLKRGIGHPKEHDIPYAIFETLGIPPNKLKQYYYKHSPMTQELLDRFFKTVRIGQGLESLVTNYHSKAQLLSLLSKLLDLDPRSRITAKEALNHPFFSQQCKQMVASLPNPR